MTCSECESLYTEYKEGQLSWAAGRDVELHLTTCSSCRSLYSELDAILRASSALPRLRASDDTAERVLSLIRSSETVPAARTPFRSWLAPRLACGAVAMAVVGLLSFFFFHYEAGKKPVFLVAETAEKERIYSLGSQAGTPEIPEREQDYSLSNAESSDDRVYSLPVRSVRARPASY